MNKLIFSDYNEELLRRAGSLLSLIETESHVKEAASSSFSRDMLREYKPDKDHFLVHLIAIGDGETYGYNKNGDYFPKKANEKYHDTFVKNGHFFREHKNRDPKYAIGLIKASAYNPEMKRIELAIWGDKKKAEEEYELIKAGKSLSFSMSCFPAGTLVKLADGTERSIEDIKCGDKILTHKGNIGIVSHTMKRHYFGPGVSIRAYGLPEEITCTYDHGIWYRTDRDSSVEDFVAAAELKKGGFIRTAINNNITSKGCKYLATIAGYYLAEGSLFIAKSYSTIKGKKYGPYNNYRTEFTFNENEDHLIKELQDAYVALGYSKPSVFHYPKKRCKVVRSHNREIFTWLLKNCGKGAYNKKLSQELMLWHPETQKIILEKWLEGDGTWHKQNYTLSGTTISRGLAWQMMEIAARNDKVCNIQKFHPKQKNKKIAYILCFSENQVEGLHISKIPEKHNFDRTWERSISHLNNQENAQPIVKLCSEIKPLSFIENGFIYHKIRSVDIVSLNEIVYDLTVPGDHGFMVHGYGVSNCRVPYDTCSCCGNKAKSTMNYCSCLKDKMGQYVPEFKKYAYAINDEPNHFDISRVRKPADRIAHYLEYEYELEKAASANEIIFSADLAKLANINLPCETGCKDTVKQQILSSLVKHEDYINFVKSASNLSSDKEKFVKLAAVNAFNPNDQLTTEQINKLSKLQPGTMFRLLAKEAAVLPFRSFAAYATGKTMEEIESDASIKYAEEKELPEVFSTIESSPCCGLEELFDPSSEFESKADLEVTDEIQKLMNEVTEKFSVKDAPLKHRILKVTITETKNKDESSEKSASDLTEDEKELAKRLALSYGFYKIAAIKAINEIIGNNFIDEAKELILICQNTI